MKTLTATELRGNIYQYLDEVLETGIPIEITKGGQTLKNYRCRDQKQVTKSSLPP